MKETESEVRDKVRRYITTNFYLDSGDGLTDTASLLDAGVVDSTGVLEILAFLERAFGVTVGDDELTAENLDSIAAISRLVSTKTGR